MDFSLDGLVIHHAWGGGEFNNLEASISSKIKKIYDRIIEMENDGSSDSDEIQSEVEDSIEDLDIDVSTYLEIGKIWNSSAFSDYHVLLRYESFDDTWGENILNYILDGNIPEYLDSFFKENPRFISDGGSSYKSFATFISDLIVNDSIDDLFEDTYYYYAIKDPKNIYSIL